MFRRHSCNVALVSVQNIMKNRVHPNHKHPEIIPLMGIVPIPKKTRAGHKFLGQLAAPEVDGLDAGVGPCEQQQRTATVAAVCR